jgi:hypothetical protein
LKVYGLQSIVYGQTVNFTNKKEERVKKVIIILFLLAISIGSVYVSAVNAGPVTAIQWPDNGNYYDQIYGSYDWNAAKSDAESRSLYGMTGHLATVTTSAENSFIKTNFPYAYSWVGAYQYDKLSEPYGHWAWVTGEEWGSPVWGMYGADNYGGIEDNAEFISSWGGMNDLAGSTTRYSYLIEYEAQSVVPEPATMSLLGLGIAGLLGFKKKRIARP